MSTKRVSDLLSAGNEEGWIERNVIGNAPLIMSVFANLMVIVADVRAYDVVYRLTDSWWKALLAALSCGITFVLWEVAWQYNSTTDNWRKTSLGMAGLAFVTSIFLGVADYLQFDGTWTNWLLGGVVVVTGIHTVVGLFYAYNDPDVARRRNKKQALAMMVDQELNAQVATQLLESGSDLLSVIQSLENKYGAEEVEKIIAILKGEKKSKPTERPQGKQKQPQLVYAAETKSPNGERPNASNEKRQDFTKGQGS